MNTNRPIIPRPGASLAILFGTFFFFLCIFSLLTSFIAPHVSDATLVTRLETFFQSLFIFIVPALITAMLATRLPATMLGIDRKPKLTPTLYIIAATIVAVPAMDTIVNWNASIHLPESMSAIEQSIRNMEDMAQEATRTLMGSDTIGSLIITILIVGIMAPLSEELFFRGAMQRTFRATGLNSHVTVWLVAVIFSFMHFQFFGFVPRLLLGAFFGYILLWGNNLWYAIIAHATNNILATVTNWQPMHLDAAVNPEAITGVAETVTPASPTWDVLLIGASLLLTVLTIIRLRRVLNKNA